MTDKAGKTYGNSNKPALEAHGGDSDSGGGGFLSLPRKSDWSLASTRDQAQQQSQQQRQNARLDDHPQRQRRLNESDDTALLNNRTTLAGTKKTKTKTKKQILHHQQQHDGDGDGPDRTSKNQKNTKSTERAAEEAKSHTSKHHKLSTKKDKLLLNNRTTSEATTKTTKKQNLHQHQQQHDDVDDGHGHHRTTETKNITKSAEIDAEAAKSYTSKYHKLSTKKKNHRFPSSNETGGVIIPDLKAPAGAVVSSSLSITGNTTSTTSANSKTSRNKTTYSIGGVGDAETLMSVQEIKKEIEMQKRKRRKKRDQGLLKKTDEENTQQVLYSGGGNSTHNETGHLRPIDWQAVRLVQRRQRPQFPDDNVAKDDNPYPIDPLGGEFDVRSLRQLNLTIDVQNLGVLLDGGRHYFPVDWIKRMIHVISVMKYNLLHFRLTDDQVFNIQLESRPLLAYPSRLDGNTKVYQPDELRDIVKFAQERGVTVIPEINVPGHAGAWGGMPELIVQCPNFICQKGYSVPLNVSNPLLRPVLKDVLVEVIDIFDKPPLLHLGGDEVEMSIPCTDEVGEQKFDYNVFEAMLREILEEVGYDDSRVIRWEMMRFIEGLDRAGNITHFWFTQPGNTGTGVGGRWGTYYNGYTNPVFNSQGLYFDVNDHDSAYDIYVHAQQNTHLRHADSPNLGIIAGTFELGVDHWLDRNVVGKLLAVAIGASHVDIRSEDELYGFYKRECRKIGFSDDICLLYADAPIEFGKFRQDLKNGIHDKVTWKQWQNDICERFTITGERRVYNTNPIFRNQKMSLMQAGQNAFFDSLDEESLEVRQMIAQNVSTSESPTTPFDGLQRLVDHTGAILDISSDSARHFRLREILRHSIHPMGMNLAQVRLIDDMSFSYMSDVFPQLQFTTIPEKTLPTADVLKHLRDEASTLGVAILPEVSLTTNAGGMYLSMFNIECPKYICQRGHDATNSWNLGIPADINDSNFVAVAYGIVNDVLGLGSSPFLHFGGDERRTVAPCFKEGLDEEPNFAGFERKLGKLLQVTNMTSNRIIRWENEERIHYPDRLGDITQCRPNDKVCPEKYGSSPYPWMATVDVRRGDAWQVFNTTRWLATMPNRPLSIVAELGGLRKDYFDKNQINLRLLAFNLATIDYSAVEGDTSFIIQSQDDFEAHYPRWCSDVLNLDRKTCSAFSNRTETSSLHVEDAMELDPTLRQTMTALTCNTFTRSEKIRVFRNDTIPTALSIQREAAEAAAITEEEATDQLESNTTASRATMEPVVNTATAND
jgi:8-oxo-dGTP pyrophosphatase MutT (NUDIX family)